MRPFHLFCVAILTHPLLVGCTARPAGDPAAANLSLLGINLQADTLDGVQARLGPNAIQHNGGDAGDSVDFICYRGIDGTSLFLKSYETDSGRVGGYQLLSSAAEVDLSGLDNARAPPSVVPQCSELPSLGRSTATASGLHLGLSARQAETLLGAPDQRTGDQLVWQSEEDLDDEFQRLRTLTLHLSDGKVISISGWQATLN
jgi:hypothetical protein